MSKKDGGPLYFLGGVGAFIYYMQEATGFSEVVLGIIKAFLWPAFVVHHVMSSSLQ